MDEPYHIQLDAYDGPLDLLLDLIRKQEMDIHNIPIAQITGQYLDYLHKLEQLDIDVSADFIYMAATLILIKSKMLLPADPLRCHRGAGRSARGAGASPGGARKIQERRAAAARKAAARGPRVVASPIFRSTSPTKRKASWWFRWWIWCAFSSRCSNGARKWCASICGGTLSPSAK